MMSGRSIIVRIRGANKNPNMRVCAINCGLHKEYSHNKKIYLKKLISNEINTLTNTQILAYLHLLTLEWN